MPNVLIRDLPASIHAELLSRAASEGRSLQQFLTAELTKLASRPTNAELFDRIHNRADQAEVSVSAIVSEIRDGRERPR